MVVLADLRGLFQPVILRFYDSMIFLIIQLNDFYINLSL